MAKLWIPPKMFELKPIKYVLNKIYNLNYEMSICQKCWGIINIERERKREGRR
jgi:hypothetical protein